MEFRRPFDPDQRAALARLYRELRNNLKELRREFPPATEEEKRLFQKYHDLVQDFAREAVAKDAKVNVRKLNALSRRVSDASFDYQFCRRLRELEDEGRRQD
jgi:endonuclease III-like uncharacterized protein